MRPRIICYMLSSVDEKIDGSALAAAMGQGEYEATGSNLGGIPAVFDGMPPTTTKAVPLKLKSVERLPSDALWIRYEVVRR